MQWKRAIGKRQLTGDQEQREQGRRAETTGDREESGDISTSSGLSQGLKPGNDDVLEQTRSKVETLRHSTRTMNGQQPDGWGSSASTRQTGKLCSCSETVNPPSSSRSMSIIHGEIWQSDSDPGPGLTVAVGALILSITARMHTELLRLHRDSERELWLDIKGLAGHGPASPDSPVPLPALKLSLSRRL
ncbi:hypothetical protein FQN52_005512 [Onygenales sp. PD_12]|nr:hypothetical protein FQN52_005512 [Onygenales sp. PD_12]